MLEPLPIATSLRWLWPELVLLVGGILTLLLSTSRDVSWLTPGRMAPITALIALAASYAVPFETVALTGDLLRSDAAAILVIRVILAATLASLLLGGRGEILLLSLAGCLAARASDSLSAIMAIQFLGLALVFLAARSGAPRRPTSRFLAIHSTLAAIAAIGFAMLLRGTAETTFASIGISLAHRSTMEPIMVLAALLPVLIIARFAAGTADADSFPGDVQALPTEGPARATLPFITRAAAATIIPAGLLLLLLRFTGSGLGSEVGSATTGGATTTIPWSLVVGLVALGTMFVGTMRALAARQTADAVSGLLLAQAGWLLAGAAQGTTIGARAMVVALLAGFPAAFVLRPDPQSVTTPERSPGLAAVTARLAGLVALLSPARRARSDSSADGICSRAPGAGRPGGWLPPVPSSGDFRFWLQSAGT